MHRQHHPRRRPAAASSASWVAGVAFLEVTR